MSLLLLLGGWLPLFLTQPPVFLATTYMKNYMDPRDHGTGCPTHNEALCIPVPTLARRDDQLSSHNLCKLRSAAFALDGVCRNVPTRTAATHVLATARFQQRRDRSGAPGTAYKIIDKKQGDGCADTGENTSGSRIPR